MNVHTKTQLVVSGEEEESEVVGKVAIVLPRSSRTYESDGDEDEGVDVDVEESDATTPTRPRPRERRVSKRPNPPARRVQANEESVYVTADEATDVE